MPSNRRPRASRNLPRSSKWVGTHHDHNNDIEVVKRNIQHVCNILPVEYCIVGEEVSSASAARAHTSSASATKHLQFFIQFRAKRTYLSWMKSHVGNDRTHFEVAKGDAFDNKLYCSKEKVVFEFGKVADAMSYGKEGGAALKAKWSKVKKLACEGKVDLVDADVFVRYYNTLNKIAADKAKPEPMINGEQLQQRFIWVHGPPGCGKSRYFREFCTHFGIDLYPKVCNTKWWDNYGREPVTLFDDFSKKDAIILGGKLKTWFDHYPFIGEFKGGSFTIRPQFIVVTSNYKISDIDFEDEVTKEAVLRRFCEIDASPSGEVYEEESGWKKGLNIFKDWTFVHEWESHLLANAYVKEWCELKLAAAPHGEGETMGEDGEMGISLADDDSLGSAALDEADLDNHIDLTQEADTDEDEVLEVSQPTLSRWPWPTQPMDDSEWREPRPVVTPLRENVDRVTPGAPKANRRRTVTIYDDDSDDSD